MTYPVPFADLTRYQQPRVTTPPAADILAAIKLGQTYADLSAIHGVSESTLRRRVTDSGLVAQRRRGATTPPLIGRDEPDWMADGLCFQTDPEAFFPEIGKSPAAAKRICGSCDVRDACLAYALKHNEQFGVWGSTTPAERKRLKKSAKS